MKVKYSVCDFMLHMDQALADASKWHNLDSYPDKERKAYEAGFMQGAREAKAAISLHANLQLKV